jgi:hypothetical protein
MKSEFAKDPPTWARRACNSRLPDDPIQAFIPQCDAGVSKFGCQMHSPVFPPVASHLEDVREVGLEIDNQIKAQRSKTVIAKQDSLETTGVQEDPCSVDVDCARGISTSCAISKSGFVRCTAKIVRGGEKHSQYRRFRALPVKPIPE